MTRNGEKKMRKILYSNMGTGTPQIAPIAIDDEWDKMEPRPWHVTFGPDNYHVVYADKADAQKRYDEELKVATQYNENLPDDPAFDRLIMRLPKMWEHTDVFHAEYVNRERELAERVVSQAKGMFKNEAIRRFYGFETWLDCITHGRERLKRLYPDLIKL